ncbi:MAG: PAS domain S-box protein [Candidatus Electrothrix sp. GM3_4]|nr:PAS domain S-box protein [Candidatus Electrothrix sp. GM3_4]
MVWLIYIKLHKAAPAQCETNTTQHEIIVFPTTKKLFRLETIMKIQHKASLIMMIFGATLVLLLSISHEFLSRRTIIAGELINLKNISNEIAQHINSHLKEKANIALTLSSAPLITKTLLKSNAEFSALPEPERKTKIVERNERWIKTKNPDDPFIQAHMNTPAAQYLKKQQELLPATYGEIFLTNAYGVMVATTGKLTTLAHAHKYWWKAGFHDGRGKSFLDDRGFDTSAQGYVLGVVVPIKDGDQTIGILKCNVNISGPLTDVIQEFSQRNPGRIMVVRTGGLIVKEEGITPLSTTVPDQIVFLLQTDTNGTRGTKGGATIMEPITHRDENQLVAFSPVTVTQGSEKIGFGGSKVSIDHLKGNKGESWHIIISLSKKKALAASHKATLVMLLCGVIFTLFTAFVALILGRLIAKPIVDLALTAERIGAGNLDARTDVRLNDEIGSLALSLNTMVERLARITVSRDKLTEEIEHRKEIEKKLSQFKLTLDQTLDCVFMFTPDTLQFFYVNQGAINQVGFTREEFFNMTPLDIKPEFTEEDFRYILEPLLDGSKKSLLLQTVHQHKNGTHIPVEIHLQFIQQPTEKNGRFLAIVRDIKERKEARQRLQKVLDAVDAMIYVADIKTNKILLVNNYIQKHFGNILGKKCWEAIQGQKGPCTFCEYQSLYENDKMRPEAHVWQIQNRKNGEWYECRDQGIQWVDGSTVRVQIATNISKRKTIEQEREKLINKLQLALSEIKILRGILPICSFCKKIRNDDGYYEQIEAYIHKHSGVDFSHTVCPTCMKMHYPEEYKMFSQ